MFVTFENAFIICRQLVNYLTVLINVAGAILSFAKFNYFNAHICKTFRTESVGIFVTTLCAIF
jgi:uncharacterized membrane protein YecN with MAPEG domain